jgi:hypothetical protein
MPRCNIQFVETEEGEYYFKLPLAFVMDDNFPFLPTDKLEACVDGDMIIVQKSK